MTLVEDVFENVDVPLSEELFIIAVYGDLTETQLTTEFNEIEVKFQHSSYETMSSFKRNLVSTPRNMKYTNPTFNCVCEKKCIRSRLLKYRFPSHPTSSASFCNGTAEHDSSTNRNQIQDATLQPAKTLILRRRYIVHLWKMFLRNRWSFWEYILNIHKKKSK